MPGSAKTQTLLALLFGATAVCGALAVGARTVFFPPRLQGFGEVTAGGRVAGWVVDGREGSRPVEVQLYVDGAFAAAASADLPRPDVLAAGRTRNVHCGYSFSLPALAAGEHEARVYAAHAVGGGGGAYRTLRQTGEALRFRVGEDGRVVAR